MSLSIQPIAMPQALSYRDWIPEPQALGDVVDLGRIEEPNLELLQELQPDLILTSPGQAGLAPLLERISPILTLAIYSGNGRPYSSAFTETARLADVLRAQENWRYFQDDVLRTVERARQLLSTTWSRPIYLISFVDDRHIAVYGRGSLFNEVMETIGLENAWRRPTNVWGFSTVGIEELAEDAHAALIHVGPGPTDPAQRVDLNPLWSHLPFVRAGRVIGLPQIWYFGALAAAARFAASLTDGLLAAGPLHD